MRWRSADGGFLLKTSGMATVLIDPDRRIARVGPGTRWGAVLAAAAPFGLAPVSGSSPTVGVTGFTLGGGVGWLARKYGFAADGVVRADVVTADGRLVTASADRNPDLFWALRGGGGNFRVVTALEFRLYPIETAYAGMLVWDIADTEKVFREWAAWAPGAPDEVTTSFRILRLPPLPEIPEIVRGRNLVVVDGAVLGSDDRGGELLDGLRALQPEIDTFARVPAQALSRLHMDPEGPTPVVSSCTMLDTLPDAAVDALLSAVGPEAQSSLLIAELRQLGGALARPHNGGGALSKLDAQI